MFDLDGTLINSIGAYFKIIEVVFDRIGLPRPSSSEVFAAMSANKFNLENLIPKEFKTKQDQIVLKAYAIIAEIYPEIFRREVELIPGTAEMLQNLSFSGTKIGIVTSTQRKYIMEKLYPLKASGVGELFDAIITIDDAPNTKPAPDPIIACLQKLEISAQTGAYIGDSHVDILAGKAAGVKTIAVLTGVDNYEALKKHEPDSIIESVAELKNVIHLDDKQ
jgi:HAD superfamily hydrolase (TIGR01549 family)